MILELLLVAALGAIKFVEYEIEGLRVGEADPLTGKPALHFYHADIDSDGLGDLVVPHKVYFQRAGSFPQQSAVPLPVVGPGVICDSYENMLFFRTPDRLEVYTWRADRWKMLIGHSVAWPRGRSMPDPGRTRAKEDQASAFPSGHATFEPFLHDIDSDGIPEIVVPGDRGLHIYHKRDNTYEPAGLLGVYPASQPIAFAASPLWPEEERVFVLPPSRNAFRLAIDRDLITVVTRHRVDEESVLYRTSLYRIDPERTFQLVSRAPIVQDSMPVPEYCRPCRLNGDDSIDFAGGNFLYAKTASLPNPLFDTVASTDSGATFQRVRTGSFPPKVSFQDFDSDGDLDMVVESSGLLDGGIRESLNRFMFHKGIRHELRVHYQNALGQFSPKPNQVFRLAIRLDRPPYQHDSQYRRYMAGELIDVTGDFDADGNKDLVVRDRSNRLAVHLNPHASKGNGPHAIIHIAPEMHFAVADVDGDGLSDIVVQTPNYDETTPETTSAVFFARSR